MTKYRQIVTISSQLLFCMFPTHPRRLIKNNYTMWLLIGRRLPTGKKKWIQIYNIYNIM